MDISNHEMQNIDSQFSAAKRQCLRKFFKYKHSFSTALFVSLILTGQLAYGAGPNYVEEFNNKTGTVTIASNTIIDQDLYGVYKFENSGTSETPLSVVASDKNINTDITFVPSPFEALYGSSYIYITNSNVQLEDGLKITKTRNKDGANVMTEGFDLEHNASLNIGANSSYTSTIENAYATTLNAAIDFSMASTPNKYHKTVTVGDNVELNLNNHVGQIYGDSEQYGISNKADRSPTSENTINLKNDVKINITTKITKNSLKSKDIAIYSLRPNTNITIGDNNAFTTNAVGVESIPAKKYEGAGIYLKNANLTVGDNLSLNNNAAFLEMIPNSIMRSLHLDNTEATLGNNLNIELHSKNTYYNDAILVKSTAAATIGDNLVINASSENGKSLYLISNSSSDFKIGNNATLNGKYTSASTKKPFSAIISNEGNITFGDGANLTSEKMSTNLYNLRNSSIIFGKNASLSSGSAPTMVNYGTINFDNGAKISSKGYSMQNVGGDINFLGAANISGKIYNLNNGKINALDSNSDKFVQGSISAKGAGSEVNINFHTPDSLYNGGALAKEKASVNLNFDNKAQMVAQAYNITEGQVNVSLNNSSKWTLIAGDSIINNLNVTNSTIDMTQFKKPLKLTAANVSANQDSEVLLKFVPAHEGSDFLDFKAGNGEFKVYTDADSLASLDGHDFENTPVWFADVASDISFKSKTVDDLGKVYKQELKLGENVLPSDVSKNGDNWYLTDILVKTIPDTGGPEISTGADSIFKNHMFLFRSAYAINEMDTLHKRMACIRSSNEHTGFWYRTFGGKLTSDQFGEDFRDKYFALQLAYDVKEDNHLTGVFYTRKNDNTSTLHSDLDSVNHGIGLYRSYLYDDNSYLDIILKHMRIDNDFNVYKDNQTMSGSFDTWGQIASVEIGKHINKDSYFLVPQAQLQYNYLNDVDYTTSSGLNVHENHTQSILGRLGLYIGHDFEDSSHYLKASLLHEFYGKQNIFISDGIYTESLLKSNHDTWLELGFGGELNVSENNRAKLYYSVERSFFGDMKKDWQVSFGGKLLF